MLPTMQAAAGLSTHKHRCTGCQLRNEAWHPGRTASSLRPSHSSGIWKGRGPRRLLAATDHPSPEDVEDLKTPEVVSARVSKATTGCSSVPELPSGGQDGSPKLKAGLQKKIVGMGLCCLDYLAELESYPKPDAKLRTESLQVRHACLPLAFLMPFWSDFSGHRAPQGIACLPSVTTVALLRVVTGAVQWWGELRKCPHRHVPPGHECPPCDKDRRRPPRQPDPG